MAVGAHSENMYDWEGVWAQTKLQCLCEFNSVDTCEEGKGLPPLFLSRKELKGPEIACRITRTSNALRDSFDLQGVCESEGNKGAARLMAESKIARF